MNDPFLESRPRDRTQTALWIIAVLGLIVFLREARGALVPFVLALLCALILSGAVEKLRRYGIPRALSACILLVLFTGVLGVLADVVSAPLEEWLAETPQTLSIIEQKTRPAQALFRQIEDTAKRASSIGDSRGSVPGQTAIAARTPVTAALVFAETGSVIAIVVTILALTLFLLATGPPTLARMMAALASDLHTIQVLKLIDAIRLEVGRYYRTLALLNLAFGTLTALLMRVLDMPNPLLWGVMAGVLNFIPYLGSATSLLVVTLVAFVTFSGVSHTLLVAAGYLTLSVIQGQFIQPIFVGRRLNLNPLIVFLALWVGGALWGIGGIFLAVPMLVAIKVGASHSAGGEVIVQFLNPSEATSLAPIRRTLTRARVAARVRRRPGERVMPASSPQSPQG